MVSDKDLEYFAVCGAGEESIYQDEVRDMARELIALRKVAEVADYVCKIAARFIDYPCYCEDAALNNYSAICSPCELNMSIEKYRAMRAQASSEGRC